MKAYIIAQCLAMFLSLGAACGTEDVIKSEAMDRRIHCGDSETVQTKDGRFRLAVDHGWVYLRSGEERLYKKLVPGICPQWIPDHKGQADRRFYVFLPVGYDGKSELWIASTDGYYLCKATEGLFFVNSTPVLSPDGKAMVTVVRPLSPVQGSRSFVTVIRDIRIADGHVSPEDWIYEADSGYITDVRFEDNERVSFKCVRDHDVQVKTISLNQLQPSAPANGAAPHR